MTEIISDAVDYAISRPPTRTREGRRQSPGQRPGPDTAKSFYYEGTTTVWHGGVAEVIPPLREAVVWGTSGTTFDITTSRWRSFTVVGSGVHSIATQQDWAGIVAANDAIGIEYHTRGGWRRHQMKGTAVVPVGPCLGFAPTIQLVAGANDWGVSTNTTSGTVDGGLGTSRLNAPSGGVFGFDGYLYFIDAGTDFIRRYDPANDVVSTTVVSLNRGTGTFYRENSRVFALGPDGRFYMYLNARDDNNTATIVSVNPDNSDGTFHYAQSVITRDLGPASNMFVAPDNSCLYVPVPKFGVYSPFDSTSAQPYTVLRMAIDPIDGTVGAVTTYAGVVGGIPDNITPNGQGEDIVATSGQAGNCVNCYVAPNGDLYTLCSMTRMVRKVTLATGHIRSMTNHVPLDSGGIPQGGGFNGDGLPSFTLGDTTPQFGRFGFNSVAVDRCGNTFINDFQTGYGGGGTVDSTALVRYVDTGGTLHTLAGTYPDVDNNMPTVTPSPANSTTIYNTSWLAWGNDGSLYVTGTACDFAHFSQNAIYRIASSH